MTSKSAEPVSETETFSSAFWESFFSGDRRTCARLITRVENEPDLLPEVRERLIPNLGKAVRIGLTGPPGVGKSTLSALLATGLAEAGHRVGVIAVDPTSPFTGGAFMGDRVRMDKLVGDGRIFVRSMASREGRGGLSPSTPYVSEVIEAFGMDRILIETVGVGQAELDVLSCADIVILVLQPSTGDAIQSLKAGIIEAADLIVVNKSDLPGVESVIQSLRFVFSLSGPRPTKPAPPILSVSAQQSTGIDRLVETLENQTVNLVESGKHLEMRRSRLAREIRVLIQNRLWKGFDALTGAEAEIERIANELVESGGSPYAYVRDACSKIEMKISEQRENHG